ncbi:hypothetical protein PAXINDRAFT_20720 [Paxillus involutus ATCC 200175]|uniref:Uncharacterized protein n=1 Tax=Paxillus involutus ATCC 200175 TaxID=664439 RepID=A0A0C9SMF2_PAXIN|nr:hypothetical protein PAXINDRAFT_20720 [Paxillus involutus ATCC 200175]
MQPQPVLPIPGPTPQTSPEGSHAHPAPHTPSSGAITLTLLFTQAQLPQALQKQDRQPPPVPSAFQLPPLLSNPSSVEPALTRVSLAVEPVHPYTTPALRPSGSVLVHPNTLNGFGFQLASNPPSFRPTDSPFQGSAPQ